MAFPLKKRVKINKSRVGNGMRWDGMGWDLPIPISSHICKQNEKISHSNLYIFFGTKIYPDSVPQDMGSCEITSQLEKFSFLVGNQTGWDRIC